MKWGLTATLPFPVTCVPGQAADRRGNHSRESDNRGTADIRAGRSLPARQWPAARTPRRKRGKWCGPQAIDAQGVIDPRECLLCLDCQILYYDSHACPPLAQERKSREKAGLPLTPISSEGYFIAVEQIGHSKKTGHAIH